MSKKMGPLTPLIQNLQSHEARKKKERRALLGPPPALNTQFEDSSLT